MADLVLWQPALFGVRPTMVIKGGMAAAAELGDPNASVPTPQPVHAQLGFNAKSPAAAATSVAFVSQAAVDDGLAEKLPRVHRPLVAIENVRGRGKRDMPENTALPHIEVDPDTYSVRVDGELIEHEPATELPMTQRYFLF